MKKEAHYIGIIETDISYYHILHKDGKYIVIDVYNAGYRETDIIAESLEDIYNAIIEYEYKMEDMNNDWTIYKK